MESCDPCRICDWLSDGRANLLERQRLQTARREMAMTDRGRPAMSASDGARDDRAQRGAFASRGASPCHQRL
eukprot:3799998-Pyramimonas_sp.AAC.1